MLSTPRMEILKLDEVICGPFSWKSKKAFILKQDKHQLQHTTSAFPIGKWIKPVGFQILFQRGILSGFQQKLAVGSDAYFKAVCASFQCSPPVSLALVSLLSYRQQLCTISYMDRCTVTSNITG